MPRSTGARTRTPRPRASRRGGPRRPAPARSRSSAAPRAGAPPEPAHRAVLEERPHAHIVCRVCGRIAGVPLDTQEELLLERLSRNHGPGWTVDRIAFSLTGACLRCREGRSA